MAFMRRRDITKDMTLGELETLFALKGARLESLTRTHDDTFSARIRCGGQLFYGNGKSIMSAFRDAFDDMVCSVGVQLRRSTRPRRRVRPVKLSIAS